MKCWKNRVTRGFRVESLPCIPENDAFFKFAVQLGFEINNFIAVDFGILDPQVCPNLMAGPVFFKLRGAFINLHAAVGGEQVAGSGQRNERVQPA